MYGFGITRTDRQADRQMDAYVLPSPSGGKGNDILWNCIWCNKGTSKVILFNFVQERNL